MYRTTVPRVLIITQYYYKYNTNPRIFVSFIRINICRNTVIGKGRFHTISCDLWVWVSFIHLKILYEYRDSPVRYFVTYHINLALKLITLIVQK